MNAFTTCCIFTRMTLALAPSTLRSLYPPSLCRVRLLCLLIVAGSMLQFATSTFFEHGSILGFSAFRSSNFEFHSLHGSFDDVPHITHSSYCHVPADINVGTKCSTHADWQESRGRKSPSWQKIHHHCDSQQWCSSLLYQCHCWYTWATDPTSDRYGL